MKTNHLVIAFAAALGLGVGVTSTLIVEAKPGEEYYAHQVNALALTAQQSGAIQSCIGSAMSGAEVPQILARVVFDFSSAQHVAHFDGLTKATDQKPSPQGSRVYRLTAEQLDAVNK